MSQTEFLYVHPMQFQRGERNISIKKPKKRLALKIRHILVSLGCVALVFFGFYKLYLFLITWEDLNIRNIEIACPNEQVRTHIAGLTRGMTWGNIFLVDISKVQKNLAAYPWVKTVQVRKIFPSSLKIDVVARTPAALLKRRAIDLIDGEGVVLEPTDSAAHPDLPILFDAGNFVSDIQEKLHPAWECLRTLSPEDEGTVESLDLSDPANVVLAFRENPTRIFLGADDFARKVAFYRNHKDGWEREYGVLEYVDLRFPDRVYFKTLKTPPAPMTDALPNPVKEAP